MPLWASLFCVFWVLASGFSLFTYARYRLLLAVGEGVSTLSILGVFALNFGVLTLTGPPLLAAALALIGYVGWFQLYAARPVLEGEIAKAEADLAAEGDATTGRISRHLVIGLMIGLALPFIYVAVELISKALSSLQG